jgi:hypothetical protein
VANAKIYIEGWIEYQVDDAQALLDATDIHNPDYSADRLAPNALMVLTQRNFKREHFSTAGAKVVNEHLSFNSLSPEERRT